MLINGLLRRYALWCVCVCVCVCVCGFGIKISPFFLIHLLMVCYREWVFQTKVEDDAQTSHDVTWKLFFCCFFFPSPFWQQRVAQTAQDGLLSKLKSVPYFPLFLQTQRPLSGVALPGHILRVCCCSHTVKIMAGIRSGLVNLKEQTGQAQLRTSPRRVKKEKKKKSDFFFPLSV